MTLEHEKIMIKSFYDIPKLSKKYTRILRIALVAQESDVSGRFKTVCIRGVGYLSVNPNTHLENKNDNSVHLSSVSIERYGIINNINDLEATLSEHYRSPKDHHVNDWKALRDYLEMECGRASHVFGYAELRPTHAQIMAARKGKSATPTAKKLPTQTGGKKW